MLLLAPLLTGSAGATTWVGGDYGGADLLLVDGDVVSGTFTNVGLLHVPDGAIVLVDPRVPFVVDADRVVIEGDLDATGAGDVGAPSVVPNGSAIDGLWGTGIAPGGGGPGGSCAHGGGGAGGGYGSFGGNGGYYFTTSSTGSPVPAIGGPTYGAFGDVFGVWLGSGGGSGGGGCSDPSGAGGAGGGAVRIEAHYVRVDGAILAIGDDGVSGSASGSGPGGGGSGGTVIVVTDLLEGAGVIDAKGGNGGAAFALSGGGGGGAGGRIVLEYALVPTGLPAARVNGGTKGTEPAGPAYPARNGGTGSLAYVWSDGDLDGVLDRHDATSGCTTGDGDGDSVCDGWDQCAGSDDRLDLDLDGVPDGCDVCPDVDDPLQIDEDGDGHGLACECDDADPNLGLEQTWYRDFDNDGDGNPSISVVDCLAPAGTVASNTDCNDTNAAISGRLEESCDGLDNDCDGTIDEPGAIGSVTSYEDRDLDGWGHPDVTRFECAVPQGYTLTPGDCADGNPAVNPGAIEVCNATDDDCDGDVDGGAVDAPTWYPDADRDGLGDAADPVVGCTAPAGDWVTDGSDCDDTTRKVGGPGTWYVDADGDGLGDPTAPVVACAQPADTSADASDCDDANAALPADHWPDGDEDGFGDDAAAATWGCGGPGLAAAAGDCADGDAGVFPGAPETCDGVDEDCDDTVDGPTSVDAVDWYADRDGDGWGDDAQVVHDCVPANPTDVQRGGDCDDEEPTAHPGGAEVAGNGIDEDCDGVDGDDTTDRDADGLTDLVEGGLGTDPDSPDSDRDGVTDDREAPGGEPVDTDGDGTIDALDEDDDGDGLPTPVEGAEDLDGDGRPNHLDLDADGDGALDAAEGQAGFLDPGGDGGEAGKPPTEPGRYGCGCANGAPSTFGWALVAALWFRRRSSR